MTGHKKKLSLTATLSVKVTPDFHFQVCSEAARRGLEMSDLLREMIGFACAPQVVASSGRFPSSTSVACATKSKPRRPRLVGPPSGSDPVVICMLASVANGLREVASALGSQALPAPVMNVERWLAVMLEMEGRLANLIEIEDGKNAY